MKKVRNVLIASALLAAVVFSPWPAGGQQQKRASPHESVYTRVGGKLVSITYGRPYSKDPKKGDVRKIWGGLVPWEKAWRIGADESTILLTEAPLAFGDTTIPAGAHTLYMVPSEKGATKLVFSKTLGKWGLPVDEKNDFARVDMTKSATEKPLDQLTVTVGLKDKADKNTGVIRVAWEDSQYSAEFTLKK